MSSLRQRALKLGATEFKTSNRKGKKWMVMYQNKPIHFGALGYKDYTVHNDEKRRENYRKRHMAIKLKDGRLAFKVKSQPAFWSYTLLWN